MLQSQCCFVRSCLSSLVFSEAYLKKDASHLMLQSQWSLFLSSLSWRNLSKEANEEGRFGSKLCWMLNTLIYQGYGDVIDNDFYGNGDD